MHITVVRTAPAEGARIESGELSPEQLEFARVFGALLAEKWKEFHFAEQVKSDAHRVVDRDV